MQVGLLALFIRQLFNPGKVLPPLSLLFNPLLQGISNRGAFDGENYPVPEKEITYNRCMLGPFISTPCEPSFVLV